MVTSLTVVELLLGVTTTTLLGLVTDVPAAEIKKVKDSKSGFLKPPLLLLSSKEYENNTDVRFPTFSIVLLAAAIAGCGGGNLICIIFGTIGKQSFNYYTLTVFTIAPIHSLDIENMVSVPLLHHKAINLLQFGRIFKYKPANFPLFSP
jgi:hypothetical protein